MSTSRGTRVSLTNDLLQSRQLLSTSTSRTCLTAGQDGDAIMIKEG